MGLGLVVEHFLGRGLEELDVFGCGLARNLDALDEAVERVAHEAVVGGDGGGLAVVVPDLCIYRQCVRQMLCRHRVARQKLVGRATRVAGLGRGSFRATACF